MKIAEFSVSRPVAVTMRIAAIVLLGVVSLTRLPVDLLPAVSIPTVAVTTQWPNVAPEEIEAQVTRPVEEAVSAVPNMYLVTSSTVEGVSTVRVQLNWGADVGQGAVDVLQLVERARQRFPTDPTLQAPIVFKYDPSQLPILILGVSGIDDPVKLRTLMDNEITPIVESANGVAAAVASGGQTRAIIVDVDPDKLRAHNVSLAAVSTRLAEENLNVPAGIAKESDTEYTIRSLGWFLDPKDIERVPLGVFNGQPVALGDVASIRDEHTETRTYTRLNGKQAVGLIITKQSGANTISTAKEVFAKLDRVKELYPELKFQVAYDQSQYIGNSVDDLKMNAILGGVLAIIILLFLLRNVRSTLVVALSIPISIVSTFALLYVCGFTINTMSLGGLALATGLIVDDAVVVLENIFRHMERDKKNSWDASIDGTTEIMSAVMASTFTVMIVFLPLLLIKGQAGQMFTQFALVVIFSISISFLDATTVVPMLASRLIKGDTHHEMVQDGHHRSLLERLFARLGELYDALDNSYRNGLVWTLHHRWMVLGGAAAATAFSLLLVPQIGTELMPQTDSGDFSVLVKMPPGTALNKTDAVIRQVENVILSNPNVATVFSASGTTLSLRGSTTALVPYQGSLTVKLKEDRKMSTVDVMNEVRKKAQIAGARVLPSQTDLVTMIMTGGPTNVEVDIFGPDLSTLSQQSKQVMGLVRGIPGLENLDVNWQEASPEIQWSIDRQKALEMGVTFNDVATTINTGSNGNIASYYQEKGFQYPIQVQLPENQRKTVSQMLDIPITPTLSPSPTSGVYQSSTPTPSSTAVNTTASTGMAAEPGLPGGVLLRQVATPKYGFGPSEITRQDRQRYIAVTGVPQGRSEGEIQADMQKALSNLKLPQGYYWDWGVNQKRRAEEFSGMNMAIFLAIALIYILLAAQFESFIHPLTVLASVPVSAVGVILALFLTGRSFGLTALIGLLMLIGIVVKNGILLVDYTNQLRKEGLGRDEALFRAGPTRLRPILMTASAAILGMMPVAMAIGKGSEIQAPMATAVVGGLLTSTILTLFVVPAVYTLFDDLTHLFNTRSDRKQTAVKRPHREDAEGDTSGGGTYFPATNGHDGRGVSNLTENGNKPGSSGLNGHNAANPGEDAHGKL